MKNKKISGMLLVLLLALLLIPGASAWSGYLNDFETAYPAAVGSRIDTCGVCHINPAGGGARNVYGSDFAANGYSFAAIESKDSDGDGFINKDEIDALTFPGDINDKPAIAALLTTVTISPLTPTIETPNTLQFTATALDQNKAPIGATLTWSSSDPAKGTIDSTTGLFKAVSQGTTTITVTAVNGSTTVTNSTIVTVSAPAPVPVLTTVTISPLTPNVQIPDTLQFTATALDQNKAPIGATLTWSSSDPAKGTIDSTTGLFKAVSQGTTTITVTAVNGSTTVTNSTIVTVTEPNQNSEVKTIKVSPPKAKIVVGKSQTFIATAFDQFKQAISAIFTWSSSNTTVGTIDNTGKFTALSAGTTTITATNGTISGSAYVKVKTPSSEKKHEKYEEEELEENGHKDVKHIEKEKKDTKHEDEENETEDEIEDD